MNQVKKNKGGALVKTALKDKLSSSCSRPQVLVLAVFLLGTIVFLPTLRYDFVWDDYILIKNNSQIKNPGQAWHLLFSDFHITQHSKFYRPLVMISFAADYALYKDNAGGYHLTNTVLHGLNSALLAFLAWLLFQNLYAAFAAGALFALHPAHPEAVAFISGRTDLLAALFSLLALIALSKKTANRRDLGALVWAPFFFLLALWSKETAAVILLPMLILLYQRLPDEPPKWRAALLKILPSGLVLILYLLLRFLVLKIWLMHQIKLPPFYSPLFLFNWFCSYLSFLLLPPQRVSFFYNQRGAYLLDAKFAAVLGLTVLFLSAVIYLIYRRRETAAYFALLVLPCLPSLYYSIYNDTVMIERYLYLPSLGLALGAGWCFLLVGAKRKIFAGVVLAVILVLYGGATLWRTPLWKNELVLFESLKKEYPASPYLRAALGTVYGTHNRLAEAQEELTAAVALEPQHPYYRNSLGWVLLHQGQTAQARAQFAAALRLMPNYAMALLGMGKSYELEGNQVLAGEYYYKAKLADPQVGVFQR